MAVEYSLVVFPIHIFILKTLDLQIFWAKLAIELLMDKFCNYRISLLNYNMSHHFEQMVRTYSSKSPAPSTVC